MNEVGELFRQAKTIAEANQFLGIIGQVMDTDERRFFLASNVFAPHERTMITLHPLFCDLAPVPKGLHYIKLSQQVRPDRKLIIDFLNAPKRRTDHDLLTELAARSVHRDSYVAIMDDTDPLIAQATREKIARIPENERITCENHTQDGRPNPSLYAALTA